MGKRDGYFQPRGSSKASKVSDSRCAQVGSSSARLQANVFDLGGMDSNLSFFWGTDPGLSVLQKRVFQVCLKPE